MATTTTQRGEQQEQRVVTQEVKTTATVTSGDQVGATACFGVTAKFDSRFSFSYVLIPFSHLIWRACFLNICNLNTCARPLRLAWSLESWYDFVVVVAKLCTYCSSLAAIAFRRRVPAIPEPPSTVPTARRTTRRSSTTRATRLVFFWWIVSCSVVKKCKNFDKLHILLLETWSINLINSAGCWWRCWSIEDSIRSECGASSGAAGRFTGRCYGRRRDCILPDG